MSDIERPADAELAAAFRAGDRDAFAYIYDDHVEEVFSYFLATGRSREEAADATNDTFIEAASQLELGDVPDQLRPWLLAIAGIVAGTEGYPEDRVEQIEVEPAPAALRPRVLDKVDRGVVVTNSAANPEWMKMGVFVAVTLITGLIGLAVSAQFEPLDPIPTTPVTSQPEAGAVPATTTTVSPSPTTSEGDGSTTSSAAPSAPAVIEVSTDTVDFGGDGSAGEVDLTNTGGQGADWSLASSSDAIAVSAGEGRLAGGETVTVELSLDREGIEEGDLNETLTVTWSGGQIEIAVVGGHEDNPIIHNPQASPSEVQNDGGPDCTSTQTTISARVRDTSPLESVVVEWSPDGGGTQETEMVPVGNDNFEAVIGPFTGERSADVRIVAFDDRGNAGGATTSLTVVACP